MLGKMVYVSDNEVHVKLQDGTKVVTNIINIHVILEDDHKRVLGEIVDVDGDLLKIGLLGEYVGDIFYSGVIRKPTLNATIRIISNEELSVITGKNNAYSFLLGSSPLYNDYPVYVDVNKFFSNHLAIFGNSGSGKSCGVARMLQNLFSNPSILPYKANFLIFDAYGEYHNAFKSIDKINSNYHFKYYTTGKSDNSNKLRIPIWLFEVNDLALLLSATEHSQLSIIEKMLRLVKIFASDNEKSLGYKNHLIAKAIIDILYTNQTAASKRNEAFSIMSSCSTPQFSLDSPVQGIGYTRKLRDCFSIDNNGQFSESNLLMEYLSGFVNDDYDSLELEKNYFYTLKDLEKALNFALISEGILHNDKIYSDAITLKVRFHSLLMGEYAEFFRYDEYIDNKQYIATLMSCENNGKAQIVNFNFEDVDDWFARAITKFFVRLLFDYSKSVSNQVQIPFNIVLEEAHRYVQKDNDQYLLGFNIFERVAKEGRKHGIILHLISQRPVELAETVISQVSNFLIFKLTHPVDIDYMKQMLPNINAGVIEKQKSLQSGTCVAFGNAFKVPIIVHFEMPNPAPLSGNCNVLDCWKIKS
ncbi:MAG: DUF87 domain-containing protein [Firmicutes bacterium]|nr:DUF87 domain-containing protein [Bacillota bacterium]